MIREKVRALICENDILEQLMSIPVTETLSYSSKADSVNPEDALRYLAEMYIDNCGVSTGTRSFADYCAEFWINRLKEDPELRAKYDEALTLVDFLPLLSDNYTEEIDKYDTSIMTDTGLRDILVEELEEAPDEEAKIIICAGICDILPHISDDSWLDFYPKEAIEDAIVNFKHEKFIRHRCLKDIVKYFPSYNIPDTIGRMPEKLRKELEEPPCPFSEKEVRHFDELNNRLVELQREVMEQVKDITLNLQEQIAKGFHQYDTFYIEGLICIDNIEEDTESLLNILADHAEYTVMTANDSTTQEQLEETIATDIYWYGNWQGIFKQLESVHGLKVCRPFCHFFDEFKIFTIDDIMKITPEMFISQVKIYI